ncbi:site-2 protease family protein, partial [Candidatus Bathyarchaeota archaeon]|nr:site-2 protease family protein [Candidatus Bathyarchaeota archaeon]
MTSETSQEGNEKEKEKEHGRLEFNFPILMLRTQMFNGVFDKLGSFRISRLLSWEALVIVPVVAVIGLYLFGISLFTLLWTPAAREISRELGPQVYLLLPGVNPYVPIFYGWLGIICAITIHEGAHGITARSLGLRVKSSGLLFFLFIPFGAFVDVDEKQIAKAKPKDSLRVMATGIGGNILVALVCLLSILVIVNGLTPVIDGVYIYDVEEGMPAMEAGLLAEDVFVTMDNTEITSLEDLQTVFEHKNAGDEVQVTVARGEKWEERFSTAIILIESDDRVVMGVSLFDFKIPLSIYTTVTPATVTLYLIPPAMVPAAVPFSDFLAPFYNHGQLSQWHVLANLFFWLWFININVAIFNALPIYPLDGGRMFNILLKSTLGKRFSEKTISTITYAVTASVL